MSKVPYQAQRFSTFLFQEGRWESVAGLSPNSPSDGSYHTFDFLSSFLQLRSSSSPRPDSSSLIVLPLLLLLLSIGLFHSPEVTAVYSGKSLFFRARQAGHLSVPVLTDCVSLSELLHLPGSPVLHLWKGKYIIHLWACEHSCRKTEQVT